jgi:anti-sigma regulatory factor (Ser/Thr protein kinase)
MSQVEEAPSAASAFRHEALFYAGEDEFIAGTVPFIVDGLERDEPVLVVVNAPKIAALRHALNGAAHDVRFADMAEIGRNPARIIPAWREFVNANGGGTRRLRGVGEPISSDRSEAALTECHRHESLLNLAFANSGDWWLLCPYDTADLPVDVVDEARRTPAFAFDAGGLPAVRLLVRELGEKARLDAARVGDLVLAADEVASNSVRHGGGRGILRIWLDPEAVVCDVRDGGRLDDPMVGRRRPRPEQAGGRGLWMANQLCELLQIRSSNAGTTVRLHVERG